MLVKEIKKIAVDRGVTAGTLKKVDLILAIQEAEGNTACFKTPIAKKCNEEGCLWREDCIPKKKSPAKKKK